MEKRTCKFCGNEAKWKLFVNSKGQGDDPEGVGAFHYACSSHVETLEDQLKRGASEECQVSCFPLMQ